MKVKTIQSSWIDKTGYRLDCNPYMSGAIETKIILENLTCQTRPLNECTLGGDSGIYHAGRERRLWVSTEEFGVPFLGSTDILKSDHSHLPLISKEQVAKTPAFIIRKDWTLITRSGTIGRMSYSRPDMDGMACSEHVMRVIPDKTKIKPGYLFAYLNSKFGIPLVVSNTYGSIIQSIEPHHLSSLPVPKLKLSVEISIHEKIVMAAEARSKCKNLLASSHGQLAKLLGIDFSKYNADVTGFSTSAIKSSELLRLDAVHFSPVGILAINDLKNSLGASKKIGQVADVFTPGIFKRPYVNDPAYGYPYFSGSELFLNTPNPRGFLSKSAPKIRNYVVKKNWLLVQDAGQLGGLIGKLIRVGEEVDKSVVSNHLMRIAPKSQIDGAYLYSLLTSTIGYKAIVRNAFGTSIPQLSPSHISEVFVPWPSEDIREAIATPILEVWKLQDNAISLEKDAINMLENSIEALAAKN